MESKLELYVLQMFLERGCTVRVLSAYIIIILVRRHTTSSSSNPAPQTSFTHNVRTQRGDKYRLAAW